MFAKDSNGQMGSLVIEVPTATASREWFCILWFGDVRHIRLWANRKPELPDLQRSFAEDPAVWRATPKAVQP